MQYKSTSPIVHDHFNWPTLQRADTMSNTREGLSFKRDLCNIKSPEVVPKQRQTDNMRVDDIQGTKPRTLIRQ